MILRFLPFLLALTMATTDDADAGANEPNQASTTQSATRAEARALLNSQDFHGAAAAFAALAAESPDDPSLWRGLGRAHFGAEKWQASVEANLRAGRSEALRDAAWWDVARAWARLGRTEEMLFVLGQLAERGATDLTNLLVLPDFADHRDEPRLRALLPDSETLADPFVEPTRVIHEWRGEAAGDAFGWIARRLGDQNGDGVFEVVTSAVGARAKGGDAQDGGANAGRVYVYSGKDGALLWARGGEAGWRLGRGVEAAGDVDGDGLEDVVASAPGGDRAVIFSGATGETVLTL
ncbi:MAG: integrin alpha, partial [Acidobacteriota bacterium]